MLWGDVSIVSRVLDDVEGDAQHRVDDQRAREAGHEPAERHADFELEF